MLQIKNCEVKFASTFKLGPINLSLEPGVTCLVGVNGAGKTTLFNALIGVQKHKGGFIKRNINIGYLPQNPIFPKAANVLDYLMYIAWIYKIDKKSRKQLALDVLKDVGLLDKKNSTIKTLSGGMLRRLAFATAIIHKPSVLLLDEPTVGLDPIQRVDMRNLITKISTNRYTVLSTHLIEDIKNIGDEIVILNNGEVTYKNKLDTSIRQDVNFESNVIKHMSDLTNGGI